MLAFFAVKLPAVQQVERPVDTNRQDLCVINAAGVCDKPQLRKLYQSSIASNEGLKLSDSISRTHKSGSNLT
ncbi:hypothetical protein NBRC3280_0624 [Acetobacter pasteurianus NBRC 3280]|uniref:Uncharacterized protein n=3 Tax=Acetobacter pasteurianus TaxID=438 RepID=A0A401WRJ5_ACEPA|nr:hypothetical protein SRCM100623_01200 [Acetobacter pasteurianus]GCD51948.1 hypothetical protein NBRC3188_0645 [Acetobacter pasteurianus NBRC 3188]GCD61615.1 hypothetical protein NBRC3278_0708 [Acetobacter pasteurianus NBRC 3278]GCD67989.1 hypothetical protein NBRC3280_0624 [Acetobacter pasteurianus NBRC 3280]